MDVEKTIKNLKLRGFAVQHFQDKKSAADYICSQISGATVGIGGCQTAEDLGLYERLIENNIVYWHWRTPGYDTLVKENQAEYFISSVNAIAESGEMFSIDGRGNRIAGQVFGHKKVFIIAGINKIAADFDSALYRARNTAAVKRAADFEGDTPCKIDGKCHDCRSKDRKCNAMTILWAPMMDMETEVILIDENLGY